jgi:hypothetical protein
VSLEVDAGGGIIWMGVGGWESDGVPCGLRASLETEYARCLGGNEGVGGARDGV